MTKFLITLVGISVMLSVASIAMLLLKGQLRKRFTASCRYIMWLVVIIRLCVPVGIFGMPTLIELPIPKSFQINVNEEMSMSDNTLSGATGNNYSGVNEDVEVNETSFQTTYFGGDNGNLNNIGSSVSSVTESPLTPEYDEQNGFVSKEKKGSNVNIPMIFFTVWLVGLTLFLAYDMIDYIRFLRKIEKSLSFTDEKVTSVYEKVCRERGVKNVPSLYSSKQLTSPMLIGYFHPAIVLPELELDDGAWELIILHELTHHERKDLWVKFASVVAKAIHWFNPVIRLAVREMNEELELSCDEKTLKDKSDEHRVEYGTVMLDILRDCKGRMNAFSTHFNPNKNTVKERILNILDNTKKNKGVFLVALCLLLCAIAGSVFGCSVGVDVDDNKENSWQNEDDRNNKEEFTEIIDTSAREITEFDFSKRILERIRSENIELFEYYHKHNRVNTEGFSVYRFDTYDKWKNYKNIFGTDYYLLKNMIDDYKEDYFKDNSVLVVYTVLPTGTWYDVGGISFKDGRLDIEMFVNENFSFTQEEHHFYMIGLKKSELDGCNDYYVYEKSIEQNSEQNSLNIVGRLDEADPRWAFLKAFLEKDTETLDELSGVTAGTFDCYKTLEFGEYSAVVREDRLGTEKTVLLEIDIVDNGTTHFREGVNTYSIMNDKNGCYLSYWVSEPYSKGMLFHSFGSAGRYLCAWLNDPWFEHEPTDKGEEYTHLERTYSEVLYRFLCSFLQDEAAANGKHYDSKRELAEDCKKIAENVFKLKDHSGLDKVFRKYENGTYSIIDTVPMRTTSAIIVSELKDSVTVQYYADRGCTVKSHLVKYTFDLNSNVPPYGMKSEMVIKSEFEPYRYYMN